MCWFGLTVASADESVLSAALVVKSHWPSALARYRVVVKYCQSEENSSSPVRCIST